MTTATVVAVWGEQPPGGIRVDARLPLDGSGVAARVFRERRPVRVDDYTTADGAIADHARTHGIRSAVGCPILVQGRLWGAMVVAHYEPEPFPAEAERRVSQFTELVATGNRQRGGTCRGATPGGRAGGASPGGDARRRRGRSKPRCSTLSSARWPSSSERRRWA